MNIKIIGSGSYIPEITVKNTDFSQHEFLNEDGTPFTYSNEEVISKFKSITGIEDDIHIAISKAIESWIQLRNILALCALQWI